MENSKGVILVDSNFCESMRIIVIFFVYISATNNTEQHIESVQFRFQSCIRQKN